MLEKNHSEFFGCLTVDIIKVHYWTMDDVKLDKDIFLADGEMEVPPEVKDLESKLRSKRIFNVSRFHLG